MSQNPGTRERTKHPGVYRRYGKYEISYTDSHDKRVFKTMPKGASLKDAQRERSRILEKMYGGETVVRSKLTVSEVLDKYLESTFYLRPKTQIVYESAARAQLRPRLGRVKISNLTRGRVAHMISEMTEEGLSSWTVRGALTVLSGACVYAMEQGWLGVNPVAQLDRRHKPKNTSGQMRILQPEEISALLRSTTEPYRLLFKTLIFTGLRIGELMRLRWDDVDFDLACLTVRESKTEAGLRTVELPEFLLKDLAGLALEQLAERSIKEESQVFRGPKGGPIKLTVIYENYKKALEKAGLPSMRIHDLRHTFASLLIAQGEDIVYVASQMGHSNPGTTLKVYAKLFDGDARKVLAREKMQSQWSHISVNSG